MNRRGGWSLMKSTWLSWMQYRSFFFLLAFMWMMPALISFLVWSAAAGDGTVGGMGKGELAFYYIVLILVNQITYAQTNWTVGDAIRYGRMNALLTRPLSPLYDALAQEMAGKTVYMLLVVPVSAVLVLVLRPVAHIGVRDALAFLPALAGAWALRFLWGYGLALISFWTARADALLALQDALVFLLAGQLAPVEFLPAPMKAAAMVLPFRSMLGFPVEVLSGSLDAAAMIAGFLVQAAWLAAAALLSAALWRAGLRRYAAVGG